MKEAIQSSADQEHLILNAKYRTSLYGGENDRYKYYKGSAFSFLLYRRSLFQKYVQIVEVETLHPRALI